MMLTSVMDVDPKHGAARGARQKKTAGREADG